MPQMQIEEILDGDDDKIEKELAILKKFLATRYSPAVSACLMTEIVGQIIGDAALNEEDRRIGVVAAFSSINKASLIVFNENE